MEIRGLWGGQQNPSSNVRLTWDLPLKSGAHSDTEQTSIMTEGWSSVGLAPCRRKGVQKTREIKNKGVMLEGGTWVVVRYF